MSERRACRLLGLARSTWRYVPKQRRLTGVEQALSELAGAHPGIGYQQLHTRMVRAGWKVGRRKIYRLYVQLGLESRKKRTRRRYSTAGKPEVPRLVNEAWAMDFMMDRLNDGRPYRLFAVIDIASRECLTIDVNRSMPATRVISVLNRIAAVRGLPATLICDNGPEYRSNSLRAWADRNDVTLHYIDPGKPTQNAYVESFNGTFRNECVDLRDIDTIREARAVVELWRGDYNQIRPHTSLGKLSPVEAAEGMKSLPFRPLLDPRATRGDNLRLMEKLKTQEAAFPTFPQAPSLDRKVP